MKPFVIPLLASLVGAAPALAKLEIGHLQAAHGPYGPERTTLDIYPHDELLLRFTVTGAKTDKDGKTDGELTIQLKGPDGKLVQDRTVPLKKDLNLGGASFVVQGTIPFKEKFAPGEYTLTLSYRDRLSSELATAERKLTCHPLSFQILAPRFFRDGERKVPAPVGGLVGETLHFHLLVVGFDKSTKKVQTRLTATVLDKDGKVVSPKPLFVEANLLNPDEAVKATEAAFNGAITLNRAGDFKLRIVVEDLIGKQKATFEAALKVTEP